MNTTPAELIKAVANIAATNTKIVRTFPNSWDGIDLETTQTDGARRWSGVRLAFDDITLQILPFENGGATGARTEITGNTTPEIVAAIINGYVNA
jgi:hypothetical protein